jgi:hypothetical protein
LCSADAILNGAAGEVPFVGTVYAMAGIEINLFQNWLGNSSAPNWIVGPDSIGLGTMSTMVNSAGKHYKEMSHGYNGPNIRRSLRMESTNAKLLGKSLPVIGNIIGVIDTFGKVNECMNKNCVK